MIQLLFHHLPEKHCYCIMQYLVNKIWAKFLLLLTLSYTTTADENNYKGIESFSVEIQLLVC